MNNPLVKEFAYNVPIVKVWQALTSTDKMKKWYFSQIRGFEPVIRYKFAFYDNNAGYQKEWIVTKAVEGKMLETESLSFAFFTSFS